MKNIKLIKLFENFKIENTSYDVWELGLIKAWGGLLYLSYHGLSENISKKVSLDEFKHEMENYYNNADSDEDLQDWMSDCPPTLNGGYALLDKNRINQCFTNIANKIILTTPLIVYRNSNKQESDWNSYTTIENNISYSGTQRKYLLPIGKSIINAHKIADNNEVILNLSNQELKEYEIK
jgi:hypothetical protein